MECKLEYQLTDWNKWAFWDVLKNVAVIPSHKKYDARPINDLIIMADTETSKSQPTQYETITHIKKGKKVTERKAITQPNHVVCWTMTIRSCGVNLVTLRGRKPSDFAKCLEMLQSYVPGEHTIIYFHNLAYDWTFLEKFVFQRLGYPTKQLNTKSHYPIQIDMENGITFRDSLILFQCKLEKAAEDLGVEHKKAVGDWDYKKIRHQNSIITPVEWGYAEFDTLSGAECLEAYERGLECNISTMPLTATGIPRSEARKRAQEARWHYRFTQIKLDYKQYCKVRSAYHGGFTHANRHYINVVIPGETRCYDFSSSYPSIILSYKMPMGVFKPTRATPEQILANAGSWAFVGKLTMIKPHLKNDDIAMPFLQFSKCEKTVNAVVDNGRIISADLAVIWVTEYDLALIAQQYAFGKLEEPFEIDGHSIDHGLWITETECCKKDYLPRWFTDYVYSLYEAKCRLKGGDPILYSLAKVKLNALYGMCCQAVVKPNIEELYESGEYKTQDNYNEEEMYNENINKHSAFLCFQWGCWITSIAAYNLFQLGKCCKLWLYSDTDSCYGQGWDTEKVKAYNDACRERLLANGYKPVVINGREFCPGVAESNDKEDVYCEFKVQGAKRYCGRNVGDGELHITIAGVPKKAGARCLDNDINKFEPGFIFQGSKTGKKTHTYVFDDIHIDSYGNECANSIDLTECDYELDRTDAINYDAFEEEEEWRLDYEGEAC